MRNKSIGVIIMKRLSKEEKKDLFSVVYQVRVSLLLQMNMEFQDAQYITGSRNTK